MALDGITVSNVVKELSALLNSLDITKTATAVIPEFTIEQSGKAEPLSGAVKSGGAASLFESKNSLLCICSVPFLSNDGG